MMTKPQDDDSRVRAFFAGFTQANETLDLDRIGECFADPFLAADRDGSKPVPRDLFLRALPRRAETFAQAGLGRAELTELTWSRLDPNYLLVRTDWRTPHLTGGDPVHLSSSYLLHDTAGTLRIVVYLNHQGLPATA